VVKNSKHGRYDGTSHQSGGDEPSSETPEPEEFAEWFSIVTNIDHVVSELSAISRAWTGSIQMESGLPYMPVTVMASELSVMGFPYFDSLIGKA
jgi:hypothetical protein